MMEKEYGSDELLSRYLAGSVDGQMQADLRLDRFDAEKAYEVFRRRVKVAKRRRRLLIFSCSAAACAVVALVVGSLAFRMGKQTVTDAFAQIEVEAPPGSRTSMELPDGSKVWLNSGSKVSYSQGFGVKERRIRISGEGWFEVARDEALPFILSSENISVQVLGTKFNFRDYPEDGRAVVTLAEGSVSFHALEAKHNEYVLKPGHCATFEKATGEVRVAVKEVSGAAGWTEGLLEFDDLPFGEIVRSLSRTFDTEIVVTDPSLENLRFSAEFSVHSQDLREMLDALSLTHRIRYRMEGGRVEIY